MTLYSLDSSHAFSLPPITASWNPLKNSFAVVGRISLNHPSAIGALVPVGTWDKLHELSVDSQAADNLLFGQFLRQFLR